MPTTQSYHDNTRLILLGFLITAFWTLASYTAIAAIFNIDVVLLIRALPNIFFNPNHNFCRFGSVQGIPAGVILIFVIMISTLTMNIIIATFRDRKKPIKDGSLLPIIAGNVTVLALILQISGQVKLIVNEHRENLLNPRHREYHSAALKDIFEFAEFCKFKLPGKHSAQFITDLDMSNDPGMLIHRYLAYYLYPIDIRNIRKTRQDCLIIFAKRDPTLSVPADYEILGGTFKGNLLAVHKDGIRD